MYLIDFYYKNTSHSYFKFWLDWCQLSSHQTTLTVTTLTFISVSSQTSNSCPPDYSTVATLKLCISIPGQTGVSCPSTKRLWLWPLLHSFQFQDGPLTVVPQTIPLWPLLQLCISIPGQTGVSCPPNRFRCENSVHCLPITMLCDGVVDCPDRSDEGVFCRKFMTLVQNLNALCRVCKMKLSVR